MIELAFLSQIKAYLRQFLDASVSSRLASDDPRLTNLDALVSSRLAANDPRLANLDVPISGRTTIPQHVVGTTPSDITTVLEIQNGSGVLLFCTSNSGALTIKIQVDSQPEETLTFDVLTANGGVHYIYPAFCRFKEYLKVSLEANSTAYYYKIFYTLEV